MRVYRSHLRMFLFGIIGVVLIVAAVDVMFGHWLSEPPENNEGVLTTRGQAQQRGDIVWGAAMIGTGTLLVGGAFFDLVRRKPVCEVGSTGLDLSIGGQDHTVAIPWTNVRDLYATTRVDGYDGSVREQLVISVLDPSVMPAEFVGAEWEGSDLLVDAHDWTKSVDDVVRAGQASLTHSRRMAQLRETDLPSVTWETSVGPGDNDAPEPLQELSEEPAGAADNSPLLTVSSGEPIAADEGQSEGESTEPVAAETGYDIPDAVDSGGEDELS